LRFDEFEIQARRYLGVAADYNTCMSNRFRPEDRVRKQADFDRVYQARVFAADAVLIVNAAANGLTHSRLGLSIGRSVGNAVVRNRWKRLIREAFRLSRSELPTELDLVVRPQKGAAAELEAVRRSLAALAARVAKRAHRVGAKGTENGEQRTGLSKAAE
jgi:ribonuclease P protein component